MTILRQLVAYIQETDDVWFATHRQIAEFVTSHEHLGEHGSKGAVAE